MSQAMTLHEQLAIGVKAIELKKQGKLDEALALQKTIPLPPYMAKWAKKRQTGWCLTPLRVPIFYTDTGYSLFSIDKNKYRN